MITTGSVSEIDMYFELLLHQIRDIVTDVSPETLERIRHEGLADPLTDVDQRRLLGRLIDAIVEEARDRGDSETVSQLQAQKERIVDSVANKARSASHILTNDGRVRN